MLILLVAAKVSGNGYLIKGLWAAYLHGANSATIDDARFFDTHRIEAAKPAWEWPVSSRYNKVKLSSRLLSALAETETVAFLVVKHDSLLSENYWNGYSDSSRSNSFSMAKSIVIMLAQIAIQKGVFQSWHQKVNSLVPEIKGPYAKELELWHLATMSSGMEWEEDYKDPFGVTARAYYGDDVSRLILSLPVNRKPGTEYKYQSGSTQLLGMTLTKATGKSLSELASDWLWKPIQAEHAATWHTDAKGTELAYCCFNSNARDFARFGKLMLHRGNWNGTQILESSFVQIATAGAVVPYYGYSFWITDSYGTPIFSQQGKLGQYIITVPERGLVIVRLGRRELPHRSDPYPEDLHTIIVEEMLKITS
jgi:CubicO group peptidase (beta-lactamase class C family)